MLSLAAYHWLLLPYGAQHCLLVRYAVLGCRFSKFIAKQGNQSDKYTNRQQFIKANLNPSLLHT